MLEGTDASGNLWKKFVVVRATDGGGANYTGSGSSTIKLPPCICPDVDLLSSQHAPTRQAGGSAPTRAVSIDYN